MRLPVLCLVPLLVFSSVVSGQECKLKFASGYTDGKGIQVGLTEDQKKFWDHDGAKKFKGVCLDQQSPDYLILWTYGLTGGEIQQSAVNGFNRGRATGQSSTGAASNTGSSKESTTDSRWTASNVFIRPSAVVRAKADYWILDLSKQPPAMIRKGQGSRDVPAGTGAMNRPGQAANASDVASTIADPAVALENALRWLRKEKKL
jgi:hypothetical protein